MPRLPWRPPSSTASSAHASPTLIACGVLTVARAPALAACATASCQRAPGTPANQLRAKSLSSSAPQALQAVNDLANSPELHLEWELAPGDIQLLHNWNQVRHKV